VPTFSEERDGSHSPFVSITPRQRSLFLGSVSALVLFVATLNLAQTRADLATLLFPLVVLLGILTLPIIVCRPTWGWLHPIVFLPLVALIETALPSLIMFVNGLQVHSALPGATTGRLSDLVFQAFVLQGLGWMTFYAGFTTLRTAGTFRLPNMRYRSITPKILLIGAVSLIALILQVQGAGGLEELMLQRGIRAEKRVAAQVGGHWQIIVRHALPSACLVWAALRPTVTGRWFFWLVFGSALSLIFIATGSRGGLVTPVVLLTIIWILQRQRMPYVRIMVLVMMAFVAIGSLGEFRSQTMQKQNLEEVDVGTRFRPAFVGGVKEFVARNTQEDALIAILGRVPEDVGLLYGRSYLSLPAAPIPSAIWPQKPDAGGRLAGQLIFDRPEGGGGVPPGPVGDALWNFRLPGVVGILFRGGAAASWLETFYRQHVGNGAAVVLYAMTLYTFEPHTVSLYDWLHTISGAILALALFRAGVTLRTERSSGQGLRLGLRRPR
jgi:hypothetical protein